MASKARKRQASTGRKRRRNVPAPSKSDREYLDRLWNMLTDIRRTIVGAELPRKYWTLEILAAGSAVAEDSRIHHWVPVFPKGGDAGVFLAQVQTRIDQVLCIAGHPPDGALHRARQTLLQDGAWDIPVSVLASLYYSVLVQLDDRVLRKDLNAMVQEIAQRLRKSLRLYEQVGMSLTTSARLVAGVEDLLLGSMLRAPQEYCLTPSNEQVKKRLLDIIPRVYGADTRTPFHDGQRDDLGYLIKVFWDYKGQALRPIGTRPHRPSNPFWQVYPPDIARSLVTDSGLKVERSSRYTSQVLTLHFIESGLWPANLRKTFGAGAIEKSLQRKPRHWRDEETEVTT